MIAGVWIRRIGKPAIDPQRSLHVRRRDEACQLRQAQPVLAKRLRTTEVGIGRPTKLRPLDMNSRNGTYLRLRQERELAHGDYIFIGKKILRVEVTS